MLIDRALVTAADYHDAIVVARRAKSAAALLALLMVAIQLALFFAARYTTAVVPGQTLATVSNVPSDASTPTTLPLPPSTPPSVANTRTADLMHYALALSAFIGLAAVIVLTVVLLMLVLTLLVGRAVGVGPVTSAFVLSLILLVLLFPWQGFLGTLSHRDFVIPGVFYTWEELTGTEGAKFAVDLSNAKAISVTVLHWARYVAFPLAAVVLLLLVQIRSNRGLRRAIHGEVDVIPATVATPGF